MKKWTSILYIFLIIGMVVGAVFWFDYIEVLDADMVLSPVRRVLGIATRESDIPENELYLLEKVRVEKERESVQQRELALLEREQNLLQQEQELQAREESLVVREESFEEREKSLNQLSLQYENRIAVLELNTQMLRDMPPAQAVQILVNYEDQLLVDTLRVANQVAERDGIASLVPYWLSLFPAQRAAEIQKKMVIKPER